MVANTAQPLAGSRLPPHQRQLILRHAERPYVEQWLYCLRSTVARLRSETVANSQADSPRWEVWEAAEGWVALMQDEQQQRTEEAYMAGLAFPEHATTRRVGGNSLWQWRRGVCVEAIVACGGAMVMLPLAAVRCRPAVRLCGGAVDVALTVRRSPLAIGSVGCWQYTRSHRCASSVLLLLLQANHLSN